MLTGQLRRGRALGGDLAAEGSATLVSLDGEGWRASGACVNSDPEIFFPLPRGGRAQLARARALCARCRVREPCLAFALRTRQEYGIWGGLTEDERRAHRRASRRRTAAAR
jgi:WhiB family redox-sensing transcriptional regulator